MDLDTATAELYAGGLDEFMDQRTALTKAAKADGDKSLAATISKLRKPSVAAWAINMLVRDSPEEVDGLLELGAAFRQAQDDLDGDELRDLTRQRQTLIAAVVEHAREVADGHGRPISESIATEIEQTFRAAMADPDAASAVRGGALTTAISGSGLGSLQISDVAASTKPVLELVKGSGAKKAKKPGKKAASAASDARDDAAEDERRERERAAKAAREALEQAEQAATQAFDRLTAAGAALEQARTRRTEARAALKELRAQLAAAEQEVEEAEDSVTDAEEARDEAKQESAAAEQAVKTARAAVPAALR